MHHQEFRMSETNWIKKNHLVVYFVLAYAITWAVEIPLAASSRGWIAWRPPFAIHYLAAYGPMLAAIVVTALTTGADGLKELLGRVLKWRVGLLWWSVALSPLLAYGAIAFVLRLVQGIWTDFRLLGEVNFLPRLSIGAAILLWVFTYGLGEEVGWRGFALPRLQRNHIALVASLICGCCGRCGTGPCSSTCTT
jgi:membrane protease YdiL (CAAX protease family)